MSDDMLLTAAKIDQQQSATIVAKVYYHVDDEPTPYCSEIRGISPDQITLADFKRVLNRSNFKFYCKANDPEVGGEVKVEIRDDNQTLHRSLNGRIELFLLTAEGSLTDGNGPMNRVNAAYLAAAKRFDNIGTDNESMLSSVVPTRYLTKDVGGINRRHLQPQYYSTGGHPRGLHNRLQENDSLMTSESDARAYDSDEDCSGTSTDITSVSRQQQRLYRRRKNRKKYRQPSRASSFTSITESSMSLNIITVTLNMDTVNFLGISIVGQCSQRGDGGIYVANIMKGGAVALDGRIEAGDMILQVNDRSFENLTNDEAVAVLRDAVTRKGPIKLVVAKCWDSGPKSCFTVPRPKDEPVRPIDTQAWIQHTNAIRGLPSILEGSEGAPTPVPGQQPRLGAGSTATSNGSGGQHTSSTLCCFDHLDTTMDSIFIVKSMAAPNSGLDIKDRTWLKIPIPMSFLGSDLVDWLLDKVHGLRDRKEAKKYASKLLSAGLIRHVVNKITFTEQCYYVLGPACADFASLRLHSTTSGADDDQPKWLQPTANAFSMASGYASMPTSLAGVAPPFGSMPVAPAPPMMMLGGAAAASQASGSGGDAASSAASDPRTICPLLPHSSMSGFVGGGGGRLLDQRSFRLAMENPHDYFVHDL